MEVQTNGVAVDLRSGHFNEILTDESPVYFGYCYVGDTRCGFDQENGLWPSRPAGYWPEPTQAQYDLCRAALAYQPWGYKIPTVQDWINRHQGGADD